jgi:hypothetical protein
MDSRPLHQLRELARVEGEAAERVFGPIIDRAADQIAHAWGAPVPPRLGTAAGPPSRWPAFEAQHRTHRDGGRDDPTWRGSRFEWAFGVSELRRERPGELAFAAGAVAPLDEAPSPLETEAWLAERRREGFEHLRNRRLGLVRVVRWLYPGEVVAREDTAAQGRYLADWVVRIFEHLEERPPKG